ncbi:MAG TPA: hypothetical protein VH540_05655 [Ktedonobacterales bacterium]|jgi:hypothetical protein
MKQHVSKMVLVAALMLSLVGGSIFGIGAMMAKAAPAHHSQACATTLPPCW